MSRQAYFYANDNVVELTGAKDVIADAFLDGDAEVACTLLDPDGEEVESLVESGVSWPIAMDYVSGSEGDFRATLPFDLDVTVGKSYTLKVVADAGAGKHGEWHVPVSVQTRRA